MTFPFTQPSFNEGGSPAARGSEEGRSASYLCDHCGGSFDGPPAGSGLFIWTRGEEVRFEEPPLCEKCAMNLTLGALYRWEDDEEEG